MAKDRNGSAREEEREGKGDAEEPGEVDPSLIERHQKLKRRKVVSSGDDSGDSDGEKGPRKKKKRKGRSRRSRRSHTDSELDDDSTTNSDSETESSEDSDSDSESESEERRRKRKERRRKEREHDKERRRRKEKERERRRKREKEERRRKKEKRKEKEKKKNKDRSTKGAVTNSWGKFGVIKETDMWNKRPEFTAWLAEVRQVNLETLPNWEEKQMFKQFMEDHNTATFPSKKYYGLDAYYRHKMDKALKKGIKNALATERTNFNDEEQRRQELLVERERQKEEKVELLKRSMQSGMAQAMKDQARLREEMAYQYRLGNSEAAAAIQKRLDPDVAM
ncbi:hypothetical protein KSP39_PZI009864 [Platanthera zijinensis]|uniref:Uncharacterized protein n=1 Tax=Platanthera zijinensis TaxID=2320716 RepID=A0AAP0BIT3_9ASPA